MPDCMASRVLSAPGYELKSENDSDDKIPGHESHVLHYWHEFLLHWQDQPPAASDEDIHFLSLLQAVPVPDGIRLPALPE